MPAVHDRRRAGLKGSPRQRALPLPGQGGYDYPRGPFGATGFPGSTPASGRTKRQDAAGRKDPAYRGVPVRTTQGQQAQWAELPSRISQEDSYRGGAPGGPLAYVDDTQPRPRRPTQAPGTGPLLTGRQIQPPARRLKLTTGPERRMTPVIGGIGQVLPKDVRNQVAQRYKAIPGQVRAYRASPNPGKTGGRFDAPALNHPGTLVHGHPDGKPVPGQTPQSDSGPMVSVPSRFVSAEGSQEGYAMNRPAMFSRGGPPPAIPPGAAPHIRGGRLSGQRYYGALADQQRIGLPSDSFGIARKRGPRHRPVRFEQPDPWSVNYYDVPPEQGTQSPDMIRRSPGGGRGRGKTSRGGLDREGGGGTGPPVRTSRKPRR